MKFSTYILLITWSSFGVLAQREAIHEAIALIQVNKDSARACIEKVLSEPNLDEYLKSTALVTRAYLKEETDISGALLDYMEALRLLDLSGKKDEATRAEIYNNLAKIYKKFSKYELALTYYHLALEVAPEAYKKTIFYNIGNAYRKQDHYEKATKAYLKALDHSDTPEDVAKVNTRLALVYLSIEKYARAEELCLKIIRQDSIVGNRRLSGAYHTLHNIYLQKGDTLEAIEALKPAITYAKGTWKFISMQDLAELYLTQEMPEKCLAICNEAEQYLVKMPLLPENFIIYHYTSEAHHELKNYEKAQLYSQKYALSNVQYAKEEKIAAEKGDWLIVSYLIDKYQQELQQEKQLQSIRNIAIVTIIFCILSCWLAYREYKNQRRKKQINSAIKKLNQDYSQYF